jgi:tetratricopeptide (TPR) repeat protein
LVDVYLLSASEANMACLFISHSSRNNEKAIAMRDWLVANGWDDVFLDVDPQSGLAPGEYWQQALRAAADRCQAVLCLITPEWMASTWCRTEFLLAKQLGKKVFPAIVGEVDISALPNELAANHQAVDLVHDPMGWDRLKEGLKRAGLDPEAFPFPSGRRPYPGFEPLTEEDAAIFFGREAQIVRGLDRIRAMSEAGAERMLVILGASGAGKSSYLRAGLWPRLKRDDRNFVLLPTIRPERGVVSGKFGLASALESALAEARQSPDAALNDLPRSRAAIGDFIDAGPDALCRLLEALRTARLAALINDNSKPPTIVIPIDQGEELFNEEGRQEAGRFMDLIAATMAQDQRVIVILGMRSDSFPRLQNEKRLATLGKTPFDLPPLPAGSLRLIIEGPAHVAKPPVKLDPRLVEALLEDSVGDDTLPLLAFTLGRLLQAYGAEGKLTLAQYDRLGRINGAVNAAVSDVLEQGKRIGVLPRDDAMLEASLREAFIPHLARVNKAGQFVRRVATKTELPAGSHELIDLFVHARLLLRDRRPTRDGFSEVIEVAHEALLREWPALRGWLEADREFLIGKDKLTEDIANWRSAAAGQKSEALLGGLALTRARQWLVERRAQDLTGEEREFIGASIAQADAATKRKRQLTGATICILLGITGAAVFEWIAASAANSKAIREKERAEQGLKLARDTAESLVSILAKDLRRIQGIQVKTLEGLLKRAGDTFDRLTAENGDDPAFQASRASMMSEFGETYKKAGAVDAASNAYSQSLQIYRTLAEKEPGVISWQRGIADQIDNVGWALQQKGNLGGALDNFKQTLAMRSAIAKLAPDEAISYYSLASSYYNIGEVMLIEGAPQEALVNQTAALANTERALSLDKDNKDFETKLSLIHVSLGTDYQALHRDAERLESNQQALAIRKRLVDSDPDNAEWQRLLSWSYSFLGDSYSDARNFSQALQYYRQCLILRQKLAKDDPDNKQAQYDLAWGYHYTANMLQETGNTDEVESYLVKAFNIRNGLVNTDENNKKWRKDLALSYISLGDLAERQENAAKALDQFEAARVIFEKLVAESPTDANWRQTLSLVCNKIAKNRKSSGDLEGAFLRYDQALTIRNQLLAKNPQSISFMAGAATSEFLVGEVLQLRGSTDEALGHYQNSRDLRKRILDRKPDDKDVLNDLSKVETAIAALPVSSRGN